VTGRFRMFAVFVVEAVAAAVVAAQAFGFFGQSAAQSGAFVFETAETAEEA